MRACSAESGRTSRDVDRGAAAARLRHRDGEQSILQIGRDAVDVDRLGQHERAREAAVSAFDAMILLARHLAAGAFAANDDAAFLGVNFDLVRAPGPATSAVRMKPPAVS